MNLLEGLEHPGGSRSLLRECSLNNYLFGWFIDLDTGIEPKAFALSDILALPSLFSFSGSHKFLNYTDRA